MDRLKHDVDDTQSRVNELKAIRESLKAAIDDQYQTIFQALKWFYVPKMFVFNLLFIYLETISM